MEIKHYNSRTWPFGSTLNAEILMIERTIIEGKEVFAVVVKDENSEGHIIIGVAHEIPLVVGLLVKMTFTAGGPVGGFWKIVSQQ